mmetsp:Transcript_70077/g.116828  ORF Transcript_70077/g.116828 Transcript_70077/m.116828 type:complete len:219 (+) Transcript_70077:964-1620(+)
MRASMSGVTIQRMPNLTWHGTTLSLCFHLSRVSVRRGGAPATPPSKTWPCLRTWTHPLWRVLTQPDHATASTFAPSPALPFAFALAFALALSLPDVNLRCWGLLTRGLVLNFGHVLLDVLHSPASCEVLNQSRQLTVCVVLVLVFTYGGVKRAGVYGIQWVQRCLFGIVIHEQCVLHIPADSQIPDDAQIFTGQLVVHSSNVDAPWALCDGFLPLFRP